MSTPENLPVAVIGAGPVGLAAAAHLATRGLDFVVLEAGDRPAASIRQWGHVRLFSPWRYNIDTAARSLLRATGWTAPDPDGLPTGAELIDGYLAPLAAHPAIAARVRYGAAVTAIARSGFDKVRTAGRERAPFLIRLADGAEQPARAVIDASGTWRTPNPLGGNGLPAHGEADARLAGWVLDGMPDVLGAQRDAFAGKRVAVVGAGASAKGTLLALAALAAQEPGTSVHWVIRATTPVRAYGGGDADALPARGAIGTRVKCLVDDGAVTVHTGAFVHEVTAAGIVTADGRKVDAEIIVNATGARPDHTPAGELRLALDPILDSPRALAPLIDPNQHSCGTVPPHGVDELTHPEPGFFIVGAKSYGRAPTFLLATGYEQARSVVAALAGDWDAARQVHLELPETGVCNANVPVDDATTDTATTDTATTDTAATDTATAAGCCGAPEIGATEADRGLATGISGGLLATLPLVGTRTGTQTGGGGCCG